MLTHRDTGKLKGVFVEFSSKDELQAALQQNGVVSNMLQVMVIHSPHNISSRLYKGCKLLCSL